MGGYIDKISDSIKQKPAVAINQASSNPRKLKVGTLNYCGIAHSPY